LLNELLVERLPLVAAPRVKPAMRTHPAYQATIERLSSAGAQFLDQEEVISIGEDGLIAFNWRTIIQTLGDPGSEASHRQSP